MIPDERLRELWAEFMPLQDGGRGFARAVEREAYEAAAKVCDIIESGRYPDQSIASGVAWECAAAIRALGEKP